MYGVVLTHSARSGSDTFGTGCFPVTKRSGAARRCEHLRDIQHSAAQGVAVMKTSGAARRCEHLEDIQHSAAQRDCDENLQCDAKMRALASHTAQRGTRCRVLTTTCGAVRRCDHLQDIQHSAAQGAVVVRKTCGEQSQKDASTCKTSSTARHKVPWLGRKLAVQCEDASTCKTSSTARQTVPWL